MNCQKIEPFIGDLAREQIMQSDVRENVLTHCEICSGCAKKLSEQRALTSALHELASSDQYVDAPHLVENNLLAALRSQVVAKQEVKTSNRVTYRLAVAAILLIIMSAAAFQVYRQRASHQPIENIPPLSATSVAPSNSPGLPSVLKKVSPSSTTLPRRHLTRASSTATTQKSIASTPKPSASATSDYAAEIATEFLSLSDGNSLNLQDGGQIVRVKVPRSALATFGLPVSMNRQNETVTADVLFGADGSARAIRFVQ